jgi:hypothetical protein
MSPHGLPPFEANPRSARQLVIGRAKLELHGWELYKKIAPNSRFDPRAAFSTLALYGHLHRMVLTQETLRIRQQMVNIIRDYGSRLIDTGLERGFNPPEWSTEADALVKLVDREIEGSLNREMHRLIGETARSLWAKLDDMELALWAAQELGYHVSPLVIEDFKTCYKQLWVDMEYFVDATTIATAFVEDFFFFPDADLDLQVTASKFLLLIEVCENGS